MTAERPAEDRDAVESDDIMIDVQDVLDVLAAECPNRYNHSEDHYLDMDLTYDPLCHEPSSYQVTCCCGVTGPYADSPEKAVKRWNVAFGYK